MNVIFIYCITSHIHTHARAHTHRFTLACTHLYLYIIISLCIDIVTLYIPSFHIDALQYSFIIRDVRYWNVLPNYIVEAPTLQLFCDRLYFFNFNAFLVVEPII